MSEYTVKFANQSSMNGSIAIYQQPPVTTASNLFTLAMFADVANSGTKATISWPLEYSFVWSDQGNLDNGATFKNCQVIPCDPQVPSNNIVSLSYINGGFIFMNQATDTKNQNKLIITCDNTVPVQAGLVGVGMGGTGSFLIETQPNTTTTFTPAPKFYAAFGNYQAGMQIDISTINNPLELAYPNGNYTAYVTMDGSNLLNVVYSV